MLEAIAHFTVIAQAGDVKDPSLSGGLLFLLLLAAIVGGIFLAKFITKSLTVSEYSSRMAIVLVTLLVAVLLIVVKWPPKFGVDLRGGINMIGSLNFEQGQWAEGERPTAADIIPVLVARVNPSGTKEIMIRPLGTDKIEVTMPTVDLSEAQDIWENLVKTGKLEFRIIANQADHPAVIEAARNQANSADATTRRQTFVTNSEGKKIGRWVDLARQVDPVEKTIKPDGPYKYVPTRSGLVRARLTGKLVNINAVNLGNNADLQGARLAEWASENGIKTLQALVVVPPDNQIVEGKHLRSVSKQTDEKGRNAVGFKLNSEGSMRMGMLTSMNVQQPMGIVLDGKLHSAPVINSAIHRQGEITGEFTNAEVEELITNLKSGKLDVALNNEPISSDFIESTLGNELKQQGLYSIGVSLILVLVFMVFYYRFAGVVATIALLLNLVLILALIMAIDQPLSLTGLAGLVLTVGMSVDANVLIFERIREELDRGAALRMAIRNGFDKARTTIVDANVTTLITAVVLYAIGTEQIKGFSVTLFLGILMSMFTAIFVSRLIFDIWERKRWLTKLQMTRILEKNKYQFVEKVGLTGIVSGLLIVAGIIGVFLLGGRILDQDLRGGSTARMVFADKQDLDQVQETLDQLNIIYKPTGEEVEFTVTEYGTRDAEFAGRKFKVDSNLPAWEGPDSGVEKFKELDEILAETFAGKLLLHDAEIQGLSRQQPAGSDGATPEDNATEESGDGLGMQWNGMPELSIGTLTTSMLVYQENQESEATGGQESGTENQEGGTENQEGESTDNPDQDPQPAAGEQPSTTQDTQPSTETPANPVGAVGAQDEDVEPEGAGVDLKAVTHQMTVSPAVLGKTLVAFLVEASERANVRLEETDVELTSPDVIEGESPLTTKSEDWTVTLNVPEAKDADMILQMWQERFNETPVFETSSSVGGQVAGDTMQQAMVAIIASLIGIIAYVWIRFQNLAFGLAAVIALIHDVLIVLGAIAISHWVAGFLGFVGIIEFKISLEVIAALLTVIGYSLNDTIVVFDRIREVRGKRTEITSDMINASISQTLSRTILTSTTTFIVVFILYWFGGDAIHGFAFALVVGVLVGTYSSIFVASPALLWLMNSVGLNPGEVADNEPEGKLAV